MARRALPLLFLLALAVVAVAVAAAPFHGETVELGSRRWLQDLGAVAPAEGPAADAASSYMSYISYGALYANNVPCPVQGASYYNCRPGAEAYPYERGCSSITLCRG
uniref:Uncharacterized protein n=1 Tax=Avena sativa TaxID=4498 RepID=A0ACD5YZ51_AVESA